MVFTSTVKNKRASSFINRYRDYNPRGIKTQDSFCGLVHEEGALQFGGVSRSCCSVERNVFFMMGVVA